MTQHPDDRLAGPDDDLASAAPLFESTFDLADRVAAQVTAEDTDRALARILHRVQMEAAAPGSADKTTRLDLPADETPASTDHRPTTATRFSKRFPRLEVPIDLRTGDFCTAHGGLQQVTAELILLEAKAAELRADHEQWQVDRETYLAQTYTEGEVIRREAAARAAAYEARAKEAANRYRDKVIDRAAAQLKAAAAREQDIVARERALHDLLERLESQEKMEQSDSISASVAQIVKASGTTGVSILSATVQANAKVAARQSGIAAAGFVGAGVAVVAPVIEVAALELDGESHTKKEYGVAAGRGAVSGLSGALAGAAAGAAVGTMVPVVVSGLSGALAGAAAGAAVGTMVPVVGTVAGFVVGAVASAKVNRKLKEPD